MPLALSSSSYPLLAVFWTILEIFLWVVWIWILIRIFVDIFRSPDLSGGAKALWFLFVLFIPLVGVLVYLIARGGTMHERATQQAQQQEKQFRSYVREAVEPKNSADQLAKLADLRDQRYPQHRRVRAREGQGPWLERDGRRRRDGLSIMRNLDLDASQELLVDSDTKTIVVTGFRADVDEIAAAIKPGSVAAVIVYERTVGSSAWSTPGGATARFIADGGISASDIVTAFDAH